MLTRRDFLRAGSAALAATALGACAADHDHTRSAATAPRPTAARHRRRGRLTDIDHVVILMQENRSFDHYFGARPNVRGFGDPKMPEAAVGPRSPWAQPFSGSPAGFLLPWHLDTITGQECIADPDHSWLGQHTALAGGKVDGFANFQGARALGYYERADLPYYWKLADEFTLCDHQFCSVLGPTNPNRYVAMTGTVDPAARAGGPKIDNDTSTPLDWPTYPERLEAQGISWRIYHEADDFDDNSVKYFKNFMGLPTTSPLYDAAIRNRGRDAFAQDAAAGNLPQVTWIVAPQAQSEHPLWPPAMGEDFTARQLSAVMGNAKLWAKTVFIITYDENGGFFDHVAPPVPEPGTKDEFVQGQPIGLGFRVPTLVVSPWSRSTDPHGRVVSHVFDHTSTLRLLESRFGAEVPNLSQWRRDTCGDLATTLDLDTYDASVPELPSTADRSAAAFGTCTTRPAPQPPTVQVAPRPTA
ncbi:MAG TPA: alkaline phosphatase family protein [Acidimicrobiales bacterium]